MSFRADLKAGHTAEDEFVLLLNSFGIKAGRNTATNQREMALYDVWDEHYQTYEIKFDRRVSETDNVYLEHEALSHSNAHFIVYKLDIDNKFYILDRAGALYAMELPQFKVVSGGDKWGAGTLIPVDEFRKIFRDCNEVFKTASKKTTTTSKVKKKAVDSDINIRPEQKRKV